MRTGCLIRYLSKRLLLLHCVERPAVAPNPQAASLLLYLAPGPVLVHQACQIELISPAFSHCSSASNSYICRSQAGCQWFAVGILPLIFCSHQSACSSVIAIPIAALCFWVVVVYIGKQIEGVARCWLLNYSCSPHWMELLCTSWQPEAATSAWVAAPSLSAWLSLWLWLSVHVLAVCAVLRCVQIAPCPLKQSHGALSATERE
jgi:hypothetical protein